MGTVDEWYDGRAYCTQRGRFTLGETLEVLCPDGSLLTLTPEWIEDGEGERITATPHAMMKFRLPAPAPLPPYSLLRRRLPEAAPTPGQP